MIFRFTLTYSGNDTVVDEPKGWTDFESEIKRDFDTHGVVYQFTSGTLKLGFTGPGRTVLETAFQNDGFDTIVTLKVERRERPTDSWSIVFNGNAIMENRLYNQDFFEVDFEQSTFQQKVINRLKTKVRIDSTKDLDGNTITGSISSQSSSWNSIRLNSNYVADYKTGGDSTEYESFNNNHINALGDKVYMHTLVNFDGVLQSDLKEYQTITESISNNQLPASSPNYNLVSEIGGDINVTGDIKYRYQGTFTTTAASGTQTVIVRWYLRNEDSAGVLKSETEILSRTLSSSSTTFNFDSNVVTDSLSGTVVSGVSPGDLIFVYAEIEGDSTGSGGGDTNDLTVTLDLYKSSRYDIEILKSSETFTVKSYLIHDLIEWVLYLVSGRNNALNSDFLGLTDIGYNSDGCGGKNLITNGFQLRNIDNAIEISLHELLESLLAIYGIGWGFEKNYNNEYDLRIELMEHFYQDAEILNLGSPVDNKEIDTYEEATFDPLVLNRASIGYKKFSTDEDFDGDQDDFLTKSEYSLPISTVEGDFNKISSLIASGRLIQATFEARSEPDKTWKLDNNNFIVSVVKSGSDWIPENNQNFFNVTGLDDATTAYNIRHAPVYMFLNQGLILNSAMFGKDTSKEYQSVSTDINKDFTALFFNYEECNLADQPIQTRTSTGNIAISEVISGQRIWKPIEISGTYAATNEQVNSIIDAMENNNADSSKNLGYVTMKDNDGVNKQVFLLGMTWNYLDEIIKIRGVEQADNYGI